MLGSELEVDEGLHLCADKLVDDDDDDDADKAHYRQRQGCKRKAVATFTVFWQPVDNHT